MMILSDAQVSFLPTPEHSRLQQVAMHMARRDHCVCGSYQMRSCKH